MAIKIPVITIQKTNGATLDSTILLLTQVKHLNTFETDKNSCLKSSVVIVVNDYFMKMIIS